MIYKENPFQVKFYVGKRNRYIPVDGLVGVADGGEMVRDKVYIKREQIYDKKKFAKIYIDGLLDLKKLTINGFRVFIIAICEMQVGKDYVWIVWSEDYGITRSSMSRGVKELQDSGFLACSEQRGKYWINQNYANRG